MSVLIMLGLIITNFDIFTKVKLSKKVWKFWTIVGILGKSGLKNTTFKYMDWSKIADAVLVYKP